MQVKGINISKRSISYARTQAKKDKMDIDYVYTDFFDIEYQMAFDAVLQVYFRYMEKSVLFPMKEGFHLSLIHRAHKDNGIFIFDVSTRVLNIREGLKTGGIFPKADSGCPSGILYCKTALTTRKMKELRGIGLRQVFQYKYRHP